MERCIQSVVNQTYKNLEIILVDDGSPDNCGAICDAWAKRDARIRVIHKQNGGVSDARNIGIDSSIGSYIAFVDSDDYISPSMLQHLLEAIKTEHAEMSICSFKYVDENGSVFPESDNNSPIRNEKLTREEAIHKLCEPYYWYYAVIWNKLYKSDLFSAIRFPDGKTHEDEFVVHQLIGKCNRIACIQNEEYFYVQHAGSIMSNLGLRDRINKAEAYLDRAEYCHQQGFKECSAEYYYKTACHIADLFSVPGLTSDAVPELYSLYYKYRKYPYLSGNLSLKKRLKMLMIKISPRMYSLVRRAVKSLTN